MILMNTQLLARVLAIVSITLLGTIAIAMTPLLFESNRDYDTAINSHIEFLVPLLGIGLVVGVISYLVLNLIHRSSQHNRSEES